MSEKPRKEVNPSFKSPISLFPLYDCPESQKMDAVDIENIALSQAVEIKPEDIESDTEILREEPQNPPLKSKNLPSQAAENPDPEKLQKEKTHNYLPLESQGSTKITSSNPQESLIQLNSDSDCQDSNEDSSEDEEEFKYVCNTVNEAVEMVKICKNPDGIEVEGTMKVDNNIQSQNISIVRPKLAELTEVNTMSCGNVQINQNSVPQCATNSNENKWDNQSLHVNGIRYFTHRRVYNEEILEVAKMKQIEYTCVYCQYASTSRQHLIHHIRFAHRDKVLVDNIKRKKRKQCPHCSAQTTDLSVHLLNHHTKPEDMEWLYCGHCDHKTKHKKALQRHIMVKHIDPTIYNHFEVLNCPECEKKFTTIGQMNKHIQNMHHRGTMKQLKCDRCDFTTVKKGTLSRHKLRHVKPIGGFKCPKCDFYGKANKDLMTHHRNEHSQRFQCHLCPYRCHLQYRLNLHLIHHQETKKEEDLNVKCKKCDYKTYRPYNLVIHMLNHKKPEELEMFECYHCNFKAKRKDNLKTHIFRHDIYKCIVCCFICDFKTRSQHELKKHLDNHSEEQKKEAESKKASVKIKQMATTVSTKRKEAETVSAKKMQGEIAMSV